MSDKPPHAVAQAGGAQVEKSTRDGRRRLADGLMAQAEFYRKKQDIERAEQCERDAKELLQ